MKHLITVKSLSVDVIESIFKTSRKYLTYIEKNKMDSCCQGKWVTNLFFENSTRTRNSFSIAAQRLGAMVLDPELQFSSLQKGESLLDTVHTFEAMGTSLFVIRHHDSGIVQWIADNLYSNSPIINAGDGANQHPTQALLDLFTIQQHKSNWSDLIVTFIGDVRYSRVAPSLIQALNIMGVKKIRVIAPFNLLPEKESPLFSTHTDFNEGLADTDVIICLRLQKERFPFASIISDEAFHSEFGLTQDRLKLAKPDAIVMHPGPMNRGVEIASEVANGPQSVILQQVRNGVAVRMAIIKLLIH